MFAERKAYLLFAVLVLAGCPAEKTGDDGMNNPTRDGGTTITDPRDGGTDTGRDGGNPIVDGGCTEPETIGEYRFLGDRRVENHFTDVLDLDRSELCNELGQYNCVDIHRVAIGGLDPYTLGLYEHLPETAATAPIAVDRLALHGCRERVDKDIAGPVLIFGAADRAVAIDTLYKRALGRAPTADEVTILDSLHGTVVASNDPNPDRSWAILACYSVLTSVESLFY